MTTHYIGTDNTLSADQNRDVRIVSSYGEVAIEGPSEGWMGHKTLASFDPDNAAADGLDHVRQADALADRIAADPRAELATLGYSNTDWLTIGA